MEFVFQIATMISGFAFPVCLIRAIRTQNEETASRYTVWSGVTFGIIALTFAFSIG